jgi:hypothetical protein
MIGWPFHGRYFINHANRMVPIIRFFLDRELITKSFASNLLSWKNSGFSIDSKLRLYGLDNKTRESIAQYLVRPPLSLRKIKYEPFKGKVLFKTKYNEYFGENFKVYDGEDFIMGLLMQRSCRSRYKIVKASYGFEHLIKSFAYLCFCSAYTSC